MSEQKFHRGDHVQIANDLGPMMSHFRSGCEAIVIGSYADQFGGDNRHSYTLHLRDSGQCSWYEECQLTLIDRDRGDLLQLWEIALEEEVAKLSNLDWIFAHGAEVAEKPRGASIEALAKCFGLDNLWGPAGEGVTWQHNAQCTLAIAKQFLIEGDLEGWLAHCAHIKKTGVASMPGKP